MTITAWNTRFLEFEVNETRNYNYDGILTSAFGLGLGAAMGAGLGADLVVGLGTGLGAVGFTTNFGLSLTTAGFAVSLLVNCLGSWYNLSTRRNDWFRNSQGLVYLREER